MLAALVFQSPAWIPIALIAAALAIAYTWWAYGPQVHSRSKLVRYGLPAIRTVALIALALTLIQPTVLRAKSPDQHGTVILLVDRSASMDVVDPARTPAQLIAIADGLKLSPDAARVAPPVTSDDVDRLRADQDRVSRAAGEWDYAKLTNRGVDAAAGRVDEAVQQLAADTAAMLKRAKAGKASPVIDRLSELMNGSDRNRAGWVALVPGRIDRIASAVSDVESRDADQLYKDTPALRAVGDKLASLPRRSLATLAARRIAGLLPAETPVQGYTFGATLSPTTVIRSDDLSLADADRLGDGDRSSTASPANATTPPAEGQADAPDADSSDLVGAARGVIAKAPPDGIAAIVLLSDGRQVNGSGGLPGGDGPTVPIFTVPIAKLAPPKDVSLNHITMPSRAFLGETITVHVEVRSTGVRGTLPVRLTATPTDESPVPPSDATPPAANNDNPFTRTSRTADEPGGASSAGPQEKSVTFNDDNTATVEFTVKVDRPGRWSLDITVPPQPGEISAVNNAAHRSVDVIGDKLHVLAVGQSAGRDYQFFCDALNRTAWVSLQQSIAPGPDASAAVEADAIKNADAIILEDASPKLLDAAGWQLLRDAVVDRGCGLIGLVGDAHEPAELLAQPIVKPLLPFADASAVKWHTWSGQFATLRMVPDRSTDDRARLPEALRLGDDTETSLHRWQELPAVYRLLQIAPLKPVFSPLLVDDQTKAAVVVGGRVGSGRVDWVGTNETWRWRFKVGQRDQDKFFLQLVRDVAGEPYAVTSNGLSLDADRLIAEPGQPIRVRARQVDATGKPTAAEKLEVQVKSTDGQNDRTLTMPTSTRGSGRFEAGLNNLPPGEYHLTIAGHASPQVTVRVAPNPEAELQNLAGDERFLRRLAETSGGDVVPIESLADLPGMIAAHPQQQPVVAEIRLWDSPYLFAFVVACFTLEWAIRKQAGLT